jgi:hypothetical protein
LTFKSAFAPLSFKTKPPATDFAAAVALAHPGQTFGSRWQNPPFAEARAHELFGALRAIKVHWMEEPTTF